VNQNIRAYLYMNIICMNSNAGGKYDGVEYFTVCYLNLLKLSSTVLVCCVCVVVDHMSVHVHVQYNKA